LRRRDLPDSGFGVIAFYRILMLSVIVRQITSGWKCKAFLAGFVDFARMCVEISLQNAVKSRRYRKLSKRFTPDL
jgi:hypothetical protein